MTRIPMRVVDMKSTWSKLLKSKRNMKGINLAPIIDGITDCNQTPQMPQFIFKPSAIFPKKQHSKMEWFGLNWFIINGFSNGF
jgi:hypothetical protein